MACRPTLVAVCAALMAGCDEAAPPAGSIVSDSAGIRLVVSQTPVWSDSTAWTLSREPVVELGAVSGEGDLLHDVRDVDRLSDGRWVVTHTGSNELRLYAPDGAYLGAIGREGQGPGEFTFPTATWVTVGDSLVVREFQRVSVLAGDGSFARSSLASPWTPLHHFPDGRFLYSVIPPDVDTFEPGYVHPDRALVLAWADGSEADTLRLVEGTEMYRFQTSAGGVSSHFAPFGRVRSAAANEEAIYTTAGGSFEILVLDRTGTLRSILRRRVPPALVTESDIQTLESTVLQSAPARTHPDRRRMFREWSYPDEMPVIDLLEVDGDGHLWVRAYAPSDLGAREWSVMEPDGRWLGQVVTPAGFEVMDIGWDYVAGVYVDEVGVEYVQAYRLDKPQ